eukprot:g7475.t1
MPDNAEPGTMPAKDEEQQKSEQGSPSGRAPNSKQSSEFSPPTREKDDASPGGGTDGGNKEKQEVTKEEAANVNALIAQMIGNDAQQKRRVCAESRNAPADKPHAFWDTQPVPKMTSKDLDNEEEAGPLEVMTVDQVRKTPLPLPDAFEWSELDVTKKDDVAEINFLCVHKKLRSKRMAPVLIKEVTRRVNLEGIWQACYTAGVVLPKPVAQCRYYHRSLNPKKLIEVGFSHLAPRMTLSRTIKLYALPEQGQLEGFRKMEEKDVDQVQKLLEVYLAKFHLHPNLDPNEVRHWLLPRDEVVYAYVKEDNTGKLTDMCSFYRLPSSILGHDKYKTLNAAYSYLNVATTVSWTDLIREVLIQAKKEDFDVFNALDVMENGEFFKDLKFGVGDGYLQYYIFNYRAPKIEAKNVGLVLL